MQTEKGRLVAQTAFPDPTTAPHFTGDFRTCKPGAYLPAVSYSGAAANRVSRDLLPEPTRWSPISVRWLQ